jgi:hypothetical protein
VRTGLEREHRRGTRRLQVGAVTPRQASSNYFLIHPDDLRSKRCRPETVQSPAFALLYSARGPRKRERSAGQRPAARDERLANPEERARGFAATRPGPDAPMNSARANDLRDLNFHLTHILTRSGCTDPNTVAYGFKH